MAGHPHLLDARRLWLGEAPHDGPLALIDLDATRDWPDVVTLPPCPVIGLGDAAHPLAPLLDAVVEPPVGLPGLVAQVLAQPVAASAVVELLRALPGMGVEQALLTESLAYGVLQGGEGHRRWLAERKAAKGEGLPPPGQLAVARVGDGLSLALDRPEAGNAIEQYIAPPIYRRMMPSPWLRSIRQSAWCGWRRGGGCSRWGPIWLNLAPPAIPPSPMASAAAPCPRG